MDFLSQLADKIIYIIPAVIIGSAVHEFFHAFTAWKLGDPTAKWAGRLTLNPLAHIDPLGLVTMIIASFGWSKPVPIDENNFKNRIAGTALVSVAGPLSNLVLSIIAVLLLKVIPADWIFIITLLITFVYINLSLTVFNLLPIPPLDGYRIVRVLIPESLRSYWENLERYFPFILIILVTPITPIGTAILGFISNIILSLARILFSIL